MSQPELRVLQIDQVELTDFVNALIGSPVTAGANNLSELTDVTIGSPRLPGEQLVFNGSAWTNTPATDIFTIGDGLDSAAFAGSPITIQVDTTVARRDATNTFQQANTFTAALVSNSSAAVVMNSAAPGLIFDESDAAADNQVWRIFASGATLTFDIRNDAGSITNNWLTVGRSGATAGAINLFGTALNFNGIPVIVGGSPYTGGAGDPDQNLWLNIAGDVGGPVAANTTTDTLTIAGGTNVRTNIAGDTITINMTGSPYAAGTSTFEGLSDVSLGSPLTSNMLYHNGTAWADTSSLQWIEASTELKFSAGANVSGFIAAIGFDDMEIQDAAGNTRMLFTDADGGAILIEENQTRWSAGNYAAFYSTGGGQIQLLNHSSNVFQINNLGSTTGVHIQLPLSFGTGPATTPLGGGTLWGQSDGGATSAYIENLAGLNRPVANFTDISYRFNTPLTAGDPGSEFMRCNNATPASVTELYFDDINYSVDNSDWWFNQLAVGDFLVLKAGSNDDRYIHCTVDSITNNTGWWTVAITVVDSGTTMFSNNQDVNISVEHHSASSVNIVGGTGITVATGSPKFTITNSDPNVDQNLWLNIAGDVGGPVAANTTTDTLTIAGGTNVRTNIAGDTITINMTGSPFTGGGGVTSSVGSPANNRVAHFTTDGNITGSANFTNDGSDVTIIDDLIISGTTPRLNIRETDAPADEGNWFFSATNGQLSLNLSSDSTPTSGQSIFSVNRTANFADTMFINTAALEVSNGQEFRIADDDLVDWVRMRHDGTDFLTDFTNTRDWKIKAPSPGVGSPSTRGVVWVARAFGSPTFDDISTSTTKPTMRIGIGSPTTTNAEATLAIIDNFGPGLVIRNTFGGDEVSINVGTNNEFVSRTGNFTTWTVEDDNGVQTTLMSVLNSDPVIQFQSAPIADVKINPRTNNNQAGSDTGWTYSTTANVYFVEANASNINFGGMSSGRNNGQWLTVINASAGPGSPAVERTITFEHEEGTATAANRFLLPGAGDIILRPHDSIQVIYDDTVSRWRCMGTTGVQASGSPLVP